MTKRRLITVAAAVALVAIPGVLLAQLGGGPGPRHGHGPREMGVGGPGLGMAHRLLAGLGEFVGLTDEQRAQIQGIVEAEAPALRELAQQSREARRAFRESQQAGQFDEAAFRAFATEQARLHVEMQVIGARTMTAVHNVLTDEQKEKLGELRSAFARRHGPGRRGGPGGGGGPGGPDAS